MGVEPMNNGFAGRRVSHFATRAHTGPLPHCAQKHKTHCCLAVGSTNLKLGAGRLIPNARTKVRTAATHAGATGVHWHQVAHGFIQ